jgi:cyclase
MVKKRLIYTLLYKNGKFCQSRNFRNQIVGDFNWLFKNYNFGYVSKFIDELVILNVEEDRQNDTLFLETVKKVLDNVFVPVAIGGGIDSIEKAKTYFAAGADKVVVNTALFERKEMVNGIASIFGAQAVIASVDYKSNQRPFIANGQKELEIDLVDYLTEIQELEIGEIMLNSIEKDGTGFGYDLEMINKVLGFIKVPLIVSGGAGKKEHFEAVASLDEVNAFSTANLLNFMGEAIPNTRKHLLSCGINLAEFDMNLYEI